MKCLGCREQCDPLTAKRGLCPTCYMRAWTHGEHRDYPDCGARPVAYRAYAFVGPEAPVFSAKARERNWQREITRVRRFEARRETEWLAQRGQRRERVA